MLNREKHQLIMGQILKDIYTDITISSLLGFKGGTCAYLFYDLPRFSVDLDFDLFIVNEANQKLIFEKIVNILSKYGQVKNQYIKRFTIFALLSYGDDDHNIKIEINTRELIDNVKNYYEIKEYLGIPILVAKKDYLFASKLVALTKRNAVATRDVYDIHYFAKNHWDISNEVIKIMTNQTAKDYLADCIKFIDQMKNSYMLHSLGEFISSEKEKSWIRTNLKSESLFMLRNYMSVLK